MHEPSRKNAVVTHIQEGDTCQKDQRNLLETLFFNSWELREKCVHFVRVEAFFTRGANDVGEEHRTRANTWTDGDDS